MWIGWIIFWEGKAACWMSGTERRKRAGQRWEVQDEGEERRSSMLDWNRSQTQWGQEREREGGRREEVMDGKRSRERDRLVLVIGVDGREKYNTGAREREGRVMGKMHGPASM